MHRMNATGLSLMLGLVLAAGPSCKSKQKLPESLPVYPMGSVQSHPAQQAQPTESRPTSQVPSIDPGLSEGGVQFNSALALDVWVHDKNGVKCSVGITPAAQTLQIPKCRLWGVQPLTGVSLATVAEDPQFRTIGGLVLTKASDADLALLKGWPKLRVLALTSENISDVGLRHIEELMELQELALGSIEITDAGLIHIEKLKCLKKLSLNGMEIHDAGLAHVKALKGLEFLDLEETNVTDAGLAHLEGLAGLQILNLARTEVTDAALVHLKKLKGLKAIGLKETKITDAGLKEIQAALPHAEISK